MNNLLVRSLTGLVFVLVMMFCIAFNQYTFLAIILVILIGSLNEFWNITQPKREVAGSFLTSKGWLIFISVVVYLIAYLLVTPPVRALPDPSGPKLKALFDVLLMQRDATLALAVLIPALLFKLFAAELFSKRENPFSNIGWNSLMVIYILVPLIMATNIYFARGGYFLLAIMWLIWFNDSAAYAFGSLLGRHKLFPRISPQKSIEGFVGGLAFVMAVAWFIPQIAAALASSQTEWVSKQLAVQLNAFGRVEWMILAFVLVLAATFGDLAESMLKRSLQIKDSGSIMPGHGGFLDRFDAFLFAMPFLMLWLWIFAQVSNLMLLIEFVSH